MVEEYSRFKKIISFWFLFQKQTLFFFLVTNNFFSQKHNKKHSKKYFPKIMHSSPLTFKQNLSQ